jgi:hypothetical protein
LSELDYDILLSYDYGACPHLLGTAKLFLISSEIKSEILSAAAYGSAMRSSNEGSQELAASRGLDLDIDMERIRPPYRCERPGEDSGTSGFEPLDLNGEAMTDEDLASWRLYRSVMGSGDFSRYIIPWGVEKILQSLGEIRPG